MADIRDVARCSGLSIATVSKYLNGGYVRPNNKEKIQNAIKELDYVVNPYARGLKTNKSMTIGVLFPCMVTPFFRNVLLALDDELSTRGYNSLVSFYNPNHESEYKKLQLLIGSRIDGLFYIPGVMTDKEFCELIPSSKFPVVLADSIINGVESDVVLVDGTDASKRAVGELIKKGHERIAIITGTHSNYTSQERFNGYLEALSEAHITCYPELIKSDDYTVYAGYKSLKELALLKEPPTAVFTTNYDITLGAVTAAHELQQQYELNIQIYGYDCEEICSIMSPRIPIVRQPEEEIGRIGAKILFDRLDGLEGPKLKKILAASVQEL